MLFVFGSKGFIRCSIPFYYYSFTDHRADKKMLQVNMYFSIVPSGGTHTERPSINPMLTGILLLGGPCVDEELYDAGVTSLISTY